MAGEPLANGRREIYTLNVGQADAHALITEDGTLNLIDADKTAVGDELDTILDGRTTPETETGHIPIETFVVTHFHNDHSRGVGTLHDHGYEIQHVVEPDENRYELCDRETGKPQEGVKVPVSERYARGLQKHDVETINQISEGDTLTPDWDSQVLAPPDEPGVLSFTSPVTGRKNILKPTGANANSIAVKTKTEDDQSVLFMGDVEDTGGLNGETQLLCQHDSDESDVDLDADILVISHHGSDNATSEAFLERGDPEMAIISSSLDDDNNNDHPRDAVLERLHDREIDVYWTAVHGTLNIDREGVAADQYTHDTTNAADLAALKHYCREHDVTPEEVGILTPEELPSETPEWITDAAPMVPQTAEELVDAAITNAETTADVHQTLKDSHPANRHLYTAIKADRNEHVTTLATIRDNRRALNDAKRDQAAAQPSWSDRARRALPFVSDPDLPEYDGPAPEEIEGPFTEAAIPEAVTDSRTAKTMRDDPLTDVPPPDYLREAEEQANTAVKNAENAEELFERLRDSSGAHSDMMHAIETPETHVPEGLVTNERDNARAIAQNLSHGNDRGLLR